MQYLLTKEELDEKDKHSHLVGFTAGQDNMVDVVEVILFGKDNVELNNCCKKHSEFIHCLRVYRDEYNKMVKLKSLI